MINGSGIISMVAGNGTQGYTGDGGAATSGELTSPIGVSLDSAGNIYISDKGYNQAYSNVRKVTASTGFIATYAGRAGNGSDGDGDPATSAFLSGPQNLTVDSSGNVFIADNYNLKIREVTISDGKIKTFAGNGRQGFTGDGGAAVKAELNVPYGAAADGSGNIYIADYQNGRIRKVH